MTSDYTTCEQLCALAKQLGIPIHYCGYKDHLPPPKAGASCYIINMASSTSGTGGTHWVSLYYTSRFSVYFDSFGQPPPLEVEAILKERSNAGLQSKSSAGLRWNLRPHTHSRLQIQDIDRGFCGQYCILFLYYMTRKNQGIRTRLAKFQDLWSKYPENNLKILRMVLSRLMAEQNRLTRLAPERFQHKPALDR